MGLGNVLPLTTPGPEPAIETPKAGLPVTLTPAFLTRRPVLVVGGGRVAERKVKNLLEAGATVRLIAPRLTPALADLTANGRLEWLDRTWQEGDVRNFPAALLVFATTDDPAVNVQVEIETRTYGRLLNRADAPQACDFTLPGVVRSGEITLTVSTGLYSAGSEDSPGDTGGASPALTAHLRRRLAETIGPEYSLFLGLLRRLRPRIKQEFRPKHRPILWKRLVESEGLDLLRRGRESEACQLLEDIVRQEAKASEEPHEEIY